MSVAPAVMQRLGTIAELPTADAARRFAQAAGAALAGLVDGLSGDARAAAVIGAAQRHQQPPAATSTGPPPRHAISL